jgi:hypothetical protein
MERNSFPLNAQVRVQPQSANRKQKTDFPPHPDTSSTHGKRPVLNPAWVFQLMGTTLEKTFCAWQEMELYHKQQPSENRFLQLSL